MKWKNREKELRRLRKKHPVIRCNSLPDLRDTRKSANYPSLSSTGLSTGSAHKAAPSPPLSSTSEFVVGTPHKQGPMVMLRSELPWAGGKKS